MVGRAPGILPFRHHWFARPRDRRRQGVRPLLLHTKAGAIDGSDPSVGAPAATAQSAPTLFTSIPSLFARLFRGYPPRSAASRGSKARSHGSSATAKAATSPRWGSTASGAVEGRFFIDCTGFRCAPARRGARRPVSRLGDCCRATARSRCRAAATGLRRRTRSRSRARPGGNGASRSSTGPATATSLQQRVAMTRRRRCCSTISKPKRSTIRVRFVSRPGSASSGRDVVASAFRRLP